MRLKRKVYEGDLRSYQLQVIIKLFVAKSELQAQLVEMKNGEGPYKREGDL